MQGLPLGLVLIGACLLLSTLAALIVHRLIERPLTDQLRRRAAPRSSRVDDLPP